MWISGKEVDVYLNHIGFRLKKRLQMIDFFCQKSFVKRAWKENVMSVCVTHLNQSALNKIHILFLTQDVNITHGPEANVPI
jgi:hypothetical protein